AWRWNPLDETWQSTRRAMAGGLYLVDVQSGGYDDATGWTGDPKDIPSPLPPTTAEASEGYSRDPDTFARSWQTLAEHTRSVVAATDALAAAIAPGFENVLHHAALWHDLGKAHDEFQTMLRKGDPAREGVLWAKSEYRGGRCRTGFRHEMASAIAWLLKGPQDIPERDLVGYLIAAHHGKVRLSIRSLPNEPAPENPDRLFARGIWQDEKLPPVTLNGITTPEIQLDLSFMKMGEGPHGPSWLARTVALRDRLGPFRLAFLETLLRVADARASGVPMGSVKSETTLDVSPALILREEPLAHGRPALSADEQSLVVDLVADGLSIQARFKPEPLYKQTGKGHYAADTVKEIRQAREQRPQDNAS
ncbi:MAG: CRISPR-associated endonuclease Cas3'', partial [Verrucomicrobiae bacterium]|nr:CRISPR-associated endonuclease Cas3'' [Verrucomicrobiae bacterium]